MSIRWHEHSASPEERLARALGYPYHLPETSYVVSGGKHLPLDHTDAESLRDGRTPVLAVGSNQSPEQIIRKFPDDHWSPILCEKCTLRDFDTVFSAHITRYGSIAAALHPSPGTEVSLFINWLSEEHLDPMHKTELGNENYVFAELQNIRLTTELGHERDNVFFYRGNAGAFVPDGTPVPLAEVNAANRQWAARNQSGILAHVHAMTDHEMTFDAFILSSIDDDICRGERAQVMQQHAKPFDYPDLNVIQS